MNLSDYNSLCPSCLKPIADDNNFCVGCGCPISYENKPHQLAVCSALNGKYYVGKALKEDKSGISYLGLDLTEERKVIIKEFYPKGLVKRLQDGYTVEPGGIAEEIGKSDAAELWDGYAPEPDENGETEKAPEKSLPDPAKAAEFDKGRSEFADKASDMAYFRRYKGLAAMLDSFEENGTVYKVLEYTEGKPLSALYDEEGAIDPEELLVLLEPVFMVVNAFNEVQKVHGGINPDNIIVTDEGARLMDFADDLLWQEAEADKSGYYAPEQYDGHIKTGPHDIGPCTDIYSLAAVYYRGITGMPPAVAKKRISWDALSMPTTLNKKINVDTDMAVIKALSVEPSKRYRMA
ncbi:MAG: hypothetical protein NC228_07545, partial [[Eubacterium] siraeum]|nr:hypothetical protein [[Eubacterium] siraeum]